MRLYPENNETRKEDIIDSLKKSLPANSTIKNAVPEPIAFGLEAIIVDVVTPEEEGSIERVEESVSKVKLISQYEMLGVSRMSSKLP